VRSGGRGGGRAADPQLGEVRRAIQTYQLVIEHYGERFDLIPSAYEALSTLYFTCFAYDRAAPVLAQIAVNAGFAPKRRARAALVAMELYSALGDRTNLIRCTTSPAGRRIRPTGIAHGPPICWPASTSSVGLRREREDGDGEACRGEKQRETRHIAILWHGAWPTGGPPRGAVRGRRARRRVLAVAIAMSPRE
jgi:hypothetical protein